MLFLFFIAGNTYFTAFSTSFVNFISCSSCLFCFGTIAKNTTADSKFVLKAVLVLQTWLFTLFKLSCILLSLVKTFLVKLYQFFCCSIILCFSQLRTTDFTLVAFGIVDEFTIEKRCILGCQQGWFSSFPPFTRANIRSFFIYLNRRIYTMPYVLTQHSFIYSMSTCKVSILTWIYNSLLIAQSPYENLFVCKCATNKYPFCRCFHPMTSSVKILCYVTTILGWYVHPRQESHRPILWWKPSCQFHCS